MDIGYPNQGISSLSRTLEISKAVSALVGNTSILSEKDSVKTHKHLRIPPPQRITLKSICQAWCGYVPLNWMEVTPRSLSRGEGKTWAYSFFNDFNFFHFSWFKVGLILKADRLSCNHLMKETREIGGSHGFLNHCYRTPAHNVCSGGLPGWPAVQWLTEGTAAPGHCSTWSILGF